MINEALDHFGGNPDQDLFGTTARDCVNRTVHLVWTMLHFPAGNANIRKSTDAWKATVQAILRLQNSFVITALNGKLYFEDSPLTKIDETAAHFMQAMAHWRLRKVVFWRGVQDHDLEMFGKVMETDPDKLLEAGGVGVFIRNLNIRDIKFVEVRYLPGEIPAHGREYWQRKLDDIGLDSEEVVTLFSGTVRQPRIISAELQVLVDAMQDPRFLSQLLWHVALGDSKEAAPEAQELLRICKRAQYLLVSNAGPRAKEVPEILSRAIHAYEPGTRLRCR